MINGRMELRFLMDSVGHSESQIEIIVAKEPDYIADKSTNWAR